MLSILDRLGKDSTTFGLAGAWTVHACFASSTPSFSKLRLRSKVFFSCKIDSIVIGFSAAEPVSEGKSAS